MIFMVYIDVDCPAVCMGAMATMSILYHPGVLRNSGGQRVKVCYIKLSQNKFVTKQFIYQNDP